MSTQADNGSFTYWISSILILSLKQISYSNFYEYGYTSCY